MVPNDGLESNVPDMNMNMLLETAPTSFVAVPPTAEYVKLGFASGTLVVIGFADATWNGLATVSALTAFLETEIAGPKRPGGSSNRRGGYRFS